ncbi:MAG: DegT/DnrJ/EryC1/StrS family aminotransferase, partial [Salinibacterium sp.]|nr:DegT/DnrJ/EryC1/StrS family aminotransferase [Salinibacterium sp.]
AGVTPVFVDIEPDHFAVDPAAVESAITPRTRAVMPVHLYGHPADLRALRAITEKYGLALLEDAAQAHLASVDGVPVGAWGMAASFSFYPTKNMTAGEGGMVTTESAELARHVRLLRNQGMERRYENEVIGFNARMSDIHAAIGREQLKKLPAWTAQRQRNARFFDENLRGVVTPKIAIGAVHSYHQYTIRIVDHDRDDFATALAERGVGSGVYYPTPVHRLPSFGLNVDLPVTELVAQQVLSLPVFPSLTDQERAHIVESVNAVAAAGS